MPLKYRLYFAFYYEDIDFDNNFFLFWNFTLIFVYFVHSDNRQVNHTQIN